ncbi:hypothetical protein F7734_14880 [Scytonema sp. UIC 10036]|uniref:hypothetical protein n=1 Tax=Scytonema sp. UIC 10036 TaxID=2304196 RepID=UPI0012DAF5EB|nr:hypothetical protein [Scytonema sp. UIC 10036]MUG93634.1 hypothetical protein [Scytonema sp. UIC 10036]
MFTSKKFLTFFVAGITLLATIVATASPVQAEQTFVTSKSDKKYTIVQIERRNPTHRPPWDYRDHNSGNNWRAERWERARMRRYRQCMIHSHRHQRRCEYILRERNPFLGRSNRY